MPLAPAFSQAIAMRAGQSTECTGNFQDVNANLIVDHQSGSYPIYIGAGLLQRSPQFINELLDCSRNALLTDETVAAIYLAQLMKGPLSETVTKLIAVPAGESSKSFEMFKSILSQLIDSGLDRHSTIIALGGGVPGDLAGFVAASYLRGVPFVQIPTTLLAQVDSSVGGKTGINMPQSKNSVGAFWQPKAVIIDPTVLKTLPPEEFTSGLAEVVKYGLIMDATFFEFLESNVDAINSLDMPTLEKMIQRCCELKADIVREDERETTGRRAILNYGHTFGHAIESVFGYGVFRHGHAVAMGMNAAAHLAQSLDMVETGFLERQNNLLSRLKVPHQFPRDRHDELLNAMQRDKKTVDGNVRFILPSSVGEVQLVDSVLDDLVLQAMSAAR